MNEVNEDWTAEADLAERLAADLGAFAVGAAPLGSVTGWGKAIKTRRRAARAGVLSVVAVAGATLPFVLRSHPADVPPPWTNHPVTTHHTVTVDPPRSAPDGTPIWSGSIDGARWSVQAGVPDPEEVCVAEEGSCFLSPISEDYLAKPVGVAESVTGKTSDGYLIGMDQTVTAVDVYLDDGTDLHLEPAVFRGYRYAVLRLPHSYPIDRLVARIPSGDQVTVALNRPGHPSDWGLWYPAGAVPDVPTAYGVVATRTGQERSYQAHQVTAYVGPFGVYVDEGMFALGPSKPDPLNGLDLRSALSGVKSDHTSRWAANEVTDAVDHVVLEYPDGTRETVEPVEIGGVRFVAAFVRADRPPLRAVSYDAAGGVTGTSYAGNGPGVPATPSAP
ncbi:hypothetical protein [Catenulispora subtropica]|uniref:Uncharacterized protein n=1 Tax=Catenulispora subtropica TaxID=450798 RepID=A0ABP5D712_9ACTN